MNSNQSETKFSIRSIRSRIDPNRIFNQNQSKSFQPWIHSDWFWLKIRFGLIRARIYLDWKLDFGLVRIHSDWCLGINRSDWFLTIFYQTRYKTFFGLVRNDSNCLRYRYRNEFQSDTFARAGGIFQKEFNPNEF